MSHDRWLGTAYSDLAAQRILDVAAALFAERGVAAVGMAEVARAAGCSRATLYRHFADRNQLRLAYVQREALRVGTQVAAEVGALTDPSERLVAGIQSALRRVRADATMSAWLTPDGGGIAAAVADRSPVVAHLVAAFLGDPDDPETTWRAGWLVRCVLSLLITPAETEEQEHRLLEQFVAPVIVAPVPAAKGLGH
ncbi:TetR/AcrR family transcriptional regulator [Nocardia stercoris]|uniref:TetR/AcrR family transcriptional regulator n=1 Tax=Nocardia stercoris TaxID=2483361 RepID=A0A3M2L9R6_9NOCA|nr:TetR/AcrR family transcriptional regulator [Nocardia stercoris]RMI31318.1 TetR/AcrR family transcriptional regulator [Nocardia stercoris]